MPLHKIKPHNLQRLIDIGNELKEILLQEYGQLNDDQYIALSEMQDAALNFIQVQKGL